MRLRPATPDELPAIAALVNEAYRGEGGARGWTSEVDYIDGPRTSVEALRRDLAQPGAVLLVPDGGAPPPDACVLLEPGAGGDGATWYLGLLTVRPGLQAVGLGGAMLAAAETWAAARGARRIRMTVVNVRESLIAWYVSRGYARTGETQPFPYDDARFGVPRRPDLAFIVLGRTLPQG